ncbi:DUF3566 domain-containing protein [Streptomyces luteosporeus]|uniref:DUF3566 domain-containing protein n=1 Tax=Streptomyces luteosporeus TaxID=173856 RepID=UPI003CD05B49
MAGAGAGKAAGGTSGAKKAEQAGKAAGLEKTSSEKDAGAGDAAQGGDTVSAASAEGSREDDARPAGRGRTMTDTRGPQPYHPPKAYEPPAEAAEGDGAAAAGGPGEGAKGRKPGKAARNEKAQEARKALNAVKKAVQAAEAAEEASTAAAIPRQQSAATAARPAPRTRKARLRVARVDPWSVMKVSFLLSVAVGVCTIVAAAVLWGVMDGMGVFSAVGGTVSDATASGSGEGGGFDLESFLSLPHVLLFTTVIAIIDVVLATALATLGAFVYNLAAGFVGGVELTLAEDE